MEKEIAILIAEDDEGHFILTKKYLREQGVQNQVRWFAGGQEILNFLFDPDGSPKCIDPHKYLLFLDLRMPGISGIQVLGKLRSEKKYDDLPVIILTSSPDPDQIEQAYNAGANAYVIKPLKNSNYQEAIDMIGLYSSSVDGGVVLQASSPAGKSV